MLTLSKILIFKQHSSDDLIFDASTPEASRKAFLYVLKDRFKARWYYAPDLNHTLSSEDRALLEIPSETVSSLPKIIQEKIENLRESLDMDEYEEALFWWKELTRVLALPDEEALKAEVCFDDAPPYYNSVEYLIDYRKEQEDEYYYFVEPKVL